MPAMDQPGTHEGGQGTVRTFESLATTSAHSVIDIQEPKPIPQTLEESNDPNKILPQHKPPSSVNDITQGKDQKSIGDDSNKKLRKPLDDQNVHDNIDSPPNADSEPIDGEEKLDQRNRNTTQDVEQESNADQGGPENTPKDVEQESNADQGGPENTTQDVEKESNAAEDESNDSKKRLPRPRRKKKNDRKGKQGGRKSSTLVDQAMKAATNFDPDGDEEFQDDDNDEEESQDVEQENNADQGGSDNTTQDVEKESNAAKGESKKRLLPCKKNNDRNGKQGGRKSSTLVDEAMMVATNFDPDEEEESQDLEQKFNADQGEPDSATQDVENESNAADDESKKRLLPGKKNSGRKGKQRGRKSATLVDQATKVTTNFDPDGEEEFQDDDNNEEEPQDVEQEFNADQGGLDNTTQDSEKESNVAEGESKKRLLPRKKNNGLKGKQGGRKSSTLVDQAMMAATNFDPDEEQSQDDDNNEEESQDVEQKFNADQGEPDSITQDVENESNAADDKSKKRLLPRKKNNGRKGKQGVRKSSTLVDQAMKATTNFDPDGEKEFQDDDNDDEEVYDCPLDVEQESFAIKDESNDSKARLRHRKKTSNAGKGKQGEKQSSKLGQARKDTINFDPDGEEEYQDDNDDPEVQEVPQEAEDESNANEEESDERNHKPVGNQTETDNIDIAQDVEQESSAVEKESKNSKERLHHDKISPSSGLKGKQGERKSSTLVGQAMKAAVNVHLVGALQGQDYDNDETEEEKSYSGRNELPNLGQTVTVISGDNPGKEFKSFGNPVDKEEESEAYSSNQDLHRHKRHTSTRGRKESSNFVKKFSATIGANQGEVLKSLNVDQILTAPVGGGDPRLADDNEKEENDDPVNECDDPSMECESFVDDNAKKEESKAFGSKKVLHLQKRQTGAQRRKEAPEVGQTSTAPIGGDVGVYLKSLADDYTKEENEDPCIECDDPNMEYELRVDDDAKEEKSDSFGSKKGSRLHKRQIGARGRRDPRNVGQITSDPLGSDPSTYFQSLADEEKEENEDQGMECDDLSMEFESLVDDGAKEEESESFGLKKVTSLQKRQIGGRGSKGPPNVGQILNIPTGGDAGEDLKFLADEQKKLELFGRKKVSPLHKHQAGAGGRKEPSNLGQILTATTSNDPGVGLKSVSTQVWASNIGVSMTVRKEDDPYGELESHDDDGEGDLSVTATNEGDTNAGLEFHEQDEELESECSNKGLGLHKPHALFLGEIEPSTDDQSVFVTGDDDPDESGNVARSGKPLSRPRTTGVREKRRT
ncbi:hypothetical protein M0R45_002050 [Rubus argutus]|uniref:Uncharacterized protein n=1 Tax=Rubus argutus TaxID=59490 RepID=A0AAW1VKC6_RUBAR